MSQHHPTLEEIRAAYIAEFRAIQKRGDPEYHWLNEDTDPRMLVTVATRMLVAVKEKGKCDWYKYNPAMRRAGKSIGLKTSKAFREAVKTHNPSLNDIPYDLYVTA